MSLSISWQVHGGSGHHFVAQLPHTHDLFSQLIMTVDSAPVWQMTPGTHGQWARKQVTFHLLQSLLQYMSAPSTDQLLDRPLLMFTVSAAEKTCAHEHKGHSSEHLSITNAVSTFFGPAASSQVYSGLVHLGVQFFSCFWRQCAVAKVVYPLCGR